MTSTSTSTMTVAFMGASTGVGLACLRHTLAAGHRCVALCRDPSKLAAVLPPEAHANLRLLQGDAHDVDAVSRLLRTDDGGGLVDTVVSTIGNRPSLSTKVDPKVCTKGMATLLEALGRVRGALGADGAGDGVDGGRRPYVVVCSTTGISRFGRDVPLAMVPLYHVLLRTPHADKRAMEAALAGSGEAHTVVQPSLLVNGASARPVRVGVEDPRAGTETTAVGYTISREDAGRWMAERLVLARDPRYRNKIAKITY